MSAAYQQLLDAALQHLQAMKEQGTRFVPVSPDTLAALAAPVRVATKHSVVSAPAPRPSPPLTPMPKPSFSKPAPRPAAPALPHPSTPLPPLPPPLAPAAKAAALEALRARVLACVKCPNLVAARKTVVFGIGDINSPLMFVGEAPGADEDAQGEPFVGKAGQLLTKIIMAMQFERSSVFIANILKCRPDTPGESAGNRKPTPAEMATCIPWLHEQINLIQPRVMVALGATALEGLFGKTAGISQLRGTWQTYRGIPVMPTYHPAYLLRNQALSEKRKVWEDMLQVLAKLGAPVSDKQRGYFLKS